MRIRFDYVERKIAGCFHSYGKLISRHPAPFIVAPLLFTMAMVAGFFHLDPVTDAIYLFTPTDAPSKMERMSIHEKWPLSDGTYIPGRAVTQAREVQVTALARDGGNILEKPYSEAVYRLDMFIQKRIKVHYAGQMYGYNELCLHFQSDDCPGNPHVHLISDLYAHGFNITFPTVRMGSESGYIGGALGGVSLFRGANNSQIVASASSWFLIYHLKFFPNNESYVSGLWENELGRALSEYPEDPYISITYFHSQTLADELKRNAESLVPRFIISFTLLVVFSAICGVAFVAKGAKIDWVLSKPVLSVLGVMNAGMGIVSGIGMLLLCGFPYNDIVAVMPFLVVAVGTDNMFLMVAAVRRTSRTLPYEERMAECMAEAAVSILITALTDAFSFGVGAITTIPAVMIFCMYTAFAITITFVYQITFFAALLALFTKWEAQYKNSVFLCVTQPEEEVKSAGVWQRLFNLGSRPNTTTDGKDLPWSSKFFDEWYGPILMHPISRVLTIAWFGVYLAGAYYGCTQLKEGLEPINLLVEDSYAIPHYHILQDHFWKYGATLQIVVNAAPDLRIRSERERVMRLAHDMATTSHSAGQESLQFWMLEMTNYYKTQLEMDLVDVAFYGMLQHYLSAKPKPWIEDVLWNKTAGSDDVQITAFRFLVGMRDIASTNSQQEATRVFREVAANYSSYNVTTFMPLWLFTDQYAIVVPNTVQNIIIALICMIGIALVLIPQPMCSFWVAIACASIDFGVIGYMTLWDVKLDAISMITIIMSIGFSVDYSAHITYGYVVSPHPEAKDKIRDALAALGWPLIQGGLSTILAVSVLADVPAYMIVTFFKTVVLAISIGLLHGILFLPVFLSIFVRGCCIIQSDHVGHHTVAPHPVKAKQTPAVAPSWMSPIEGDANLYAYQSSAFSPSIETSFHDKSH
ncbi:hypothetical protein PENTCL1PPCAC_20749 [Pristionchus entomophagus]|uniref:SSD domain-containing protein n=1 Tax=Pristionchus entomophagus TaxID=358040 RepID=A0AAV5TX84_9BILA|nr:hypothetical protein PENTCL1PPCAC_20749 [Pristionchus entomophagus]